MLQCQSHCSSTELWPPRGGMYQQQQVPILLFKASRVLACLSGIKYSYCTEAGYMRNSNSFKVFLSLLELERIRNRISVALQDQNASFLNPASVASAISRVVVAALRNNVLQMETITEREVQHSEVYPVISVTTSCVYIPYNPAPKGCQNAAHAFWTVCVSDQSV